MKSSRNKSARPWRSALAAGAVCAGLGTLLFLLGNRWLIERGYDWLYLMARPAPPPEAIIVYMDVESYAALKQVGAERWDRNLHARLVDKLTTDQARVVVFDVIFDTPSTPDTDANFARAIRRNGKVVLAAGQVTRTRHQVHSKSVQRPIDALFDAAAGWGVTGFYLDVQTEGEQEVVNTIARSFFVGDDIVPSLIWTAAKVADAPITREPGARQPRTWIRYYGPAHTIPSVSYKDALEKEHGFFRDRSVFIGFQPGTSLPMESTDAFPTPHWLWKGALFPGVEIGATAYVNLLRRDGFHEMSTHWQWVTFAAAGFGLGWLLVLLRPWPALGVAAAGMIATYGVALNVANHHLRFAWPIVVFVQIPLALAWSVGGLWVRLRLDRDVLTRTLEETTRLVESTKLTAQKPAQLVPDHEMVRLVGKGAYGEVWLARNAVGVFHAVKIVRRAAFPSDIPYEREFRGIQKFMPVSRSHPGLVHVLHVGRNETERCFYCIMEAGDDQTTGQKIDPETYTPKSLASELKWRGRLGPEETVRLGLALAQAIEHLHQSRLIHRDIKPGNIIYVNGQPKFADIGLVTDIAGDGKDVSFLGTQGYIPPEGPGSPGADVYALGKVLYEAAMGRDREFFPEVPTAVYEEPDDSLLRRLQKVIFKACESNAQDRYQTAAQLQADLAALERHRTAG